MTGALWPAFLPPSAHGDDSRCLVSAKGVRLRFADGTTALCGTSGLWNTNLGYGNPAVARAVARAMDEASYLGTFRWENAPIREAADRLCAVAGGDWYSRVVFSTSGGAANDLVMKLARQHHALRGQPRRQLVIGLRGGYHGLTFGAFALTSDELGQQQYGVDRRLVRHIEPNDVSQLRRLLERSGDQVAAIVVEPVLGSGAVELTPEYVAELVSQRDQHGFLLVADEVATGFGRAGEFFASQAWPGQPDLLVTSKALTNGTCAAAAVLVAAPVWETFQDRDAVLGHAETQAGTAVTAAAINATLDEMAALDAVAAGRRVSQQLDHHLEQLLADEQCVTSVSGRGCMRAVAVADPEGNSLTGDAVGELVTQVRRAGAVVHPGPSGFQLLPALVYTQAETEELFARVREGLASVRRPVAAGAS